MAFSINAHPGMGYPTYTVVNTDMGLPEGVFIDFCGHLQKCTCLWHLLYSLILYSVWLYSLLGCYSTSEFRMLLQKGD